MSDLTIRIGGIHATPLSAQKQLLNMLIWGKPACGKTVLAATAPGKKLWLLFDPGGTASLDDDPDIIVADFSGYPINSYADFKAGGTVERDLIKAIKDHGISTLVFDSLTTYAQNALSYGIVSGKANSRGFTASVEAPGLQGYGIRTAMVLEVTSMILRLCTQLGVHCLLISHEKEEYNDKNELTSITFALAGGAATVLPAKIGEIWMMQDTGKERLLYVRSHGMWTPMRTRMFRPLKETRFVWKFDQSDPATHDTNRISDWYERWSEGGFAKQALPGHQ